MNLETVFENTDFVHTSGTKEELQVAVYLKKQCENIGVQVKMENFRVSMSAIKKRIFLPMAWRYLVKLSEAVAAEL